MPALGHLGYPPSAAACWAIHVFPRSPLGGRPVGAETRDTDTVIDLQ